MTVIYVLLNTKKPDTQGIWLSKNYQSILGRDNYSADCMLEILKKISSLRNILISINNTIIHIEYLLLNIEIQINACHI